MSLTIKVNSYAMQDLNVSLNRLAESTGKTLKEVLPSQMRLLASDLAYVTYPKGKGSGDNANHIKTIRRRIAQVYPSIQFIYTLLRYKDPKIIKPFAFAFINKKYQKAQQMLDQHLPNMNILIGRFDGGKLHKDQSEQKNVSRRLLVTSYSRVESYANKTVRKSGFAKGGFATAARQLGGVRGIPGWATRQKSPGTGTVTGDGRTLTVTMTNLVNYLGEGALKKGDESIAVSNRQKNVTILLDRIQTNQIKKLMRR